MFLDDDSSLNEVKTVAFYITDILTCCKQAPSYFLSFSYLKVCFDFLEERRDNFKM